MNDQLSARSCADFTAALASDAPVPGGGGAAALCGALAAALAAMAVRITAHSPRRQADAPALADLAAGAERLRTALLALIDADAAGFAPLAAAYAVPKGDPSRQTVLAAASEAACRAPLEMLRKCRETAELLQRAFVQTNKLLLSDVGCAAALCRAALTAAAMNVFVNTGALAPGAKARTEAEAGALLREALPVCDTISDAVLRRLQGGE